MSAFQVSQCSNLSVKLSDVNMKTEWKQGHTPQNDVTPNEILLFVQ